MPEKEEILRLWNMGLNRMQVINEYMREHNRKAKSSRDIDRITKREAMEIVEPILFEYETQRMKEEKNADK